jgi:hypothetical protein
LLQTKNGRRTMDKDETTSWHIGIAAEAFAAGQFARMGFDVSVQYGANQPEYDLLVVCADGTSKVSVKGSREGKWGLAQSYLQKADYHTAVDKWRAKLRDDTVLCLVQFHGVSENELPRMYLATPDEVAARLKQTVKGRGATILYENHQWGPRAAASGSVDSIPGSWKFTRERAMQLIRRSSAQK